VSFTISPPIRIAAAAALLLALVFAGAMMTLGRSHAPSATQPPLRTHAGTTATKPAVHHSASPAKTTHKTAAKATHKTTSAKQTTHAAAATHAATATPAATKAAAKTAAKHATAKHAVQHKVARGNLVDATLPQPLQWQLSQHKIVVVSVYDPQSDVDAISVAEAHAGAAEAGAGFLLVNVLDDSLAGLLTGVLPGGGLLPDPGVLIYRAPGTLALRIDGFADRDSIAQAAANALAGEDGPTTAPVAAAVVTP
jgi:hypothetical protein